MLKRFSPKEISPKGWLKKQLEIEASGLPGNLDKIWPDVRDSAWIGGDREGWERVPYWLDGFIPLAYQLNNDDMKSRAAKYINAIIDRQCKDGWICPCSHEEIPKYDVWAVFLIGKVLALYHEYAGGRRVYNALYQAMRNLYDLLKNGTVKLFNWGKFRWYECYIPIEYLYRRKKEPWLIELAEILKSQGADYKDFYKLWEVPKNQWRYDTHIVNLSMELKSEAVLKTLVGKSDISAEERFKQLERYNGTAVATFTGDECLSGLRNNQGTELCSVNEIMYSYEMLYFATGKTVWLDRLEQAAFNALPATFTDDMWAHQYVQMVNQISAKPFLGKSYFRTNNSEAHIYGLEPNFGCCTANAAQGYPKLINSIFAKGRGSIVCNTMLPAELDTKIGASKVKISIDTKYPFRHSGKYTISVDRDTKFTLKIRIPSFVEGVKLNGTPVSYKSYLEISKVWRGTEELLLELIASPKMKKRPYGLYTATWGNMVFSLPVSADIKKVEYEKNGVVRAYPYCDYHMDTTGEWQYGFSDCKFEVIEDSGDEIPFSSIRPSVMLKTKLAKIDWGYEDGYDDVSAYKPNSRLAMGEAQEIILYPYGSAKLRMTEMPIVKHK